MLKRKPAPQRQERDWFTFSTSLLHSLCSDYIAMRLLYWLEPFTTSSTVLTKMLEVVEKSLKLHLAVQTQTTTALTDARTMYGHNIEKLRAKCASYESAFDHPDIRALTRDLNDNDGKLYQFLRYGSQETTIGSQANLTALLPVVDRVFANSLLLLPEHHRRVLLFCSALKNLVTRSRFDQSRDPNQLIEILALDNPYFAEFSELFTALDKQNEDLAAQMRRDMEASGAQSEA
ncbi:hypothetical protein [Lysobacter fragariae]